MHENADAGPSHASDQLGISTLYQKDGLEIDVVFGDLYIAGEHALNAATPFAQPTPAHPNATFNTPYTSGGTVNNVNGNIQNQVLNHHYHGAPPVTALNPMHSLSPFNDAPVDRISPCFMGREDDIQAIANAVCPCSGDAPSRYAVWGMPGLGKSQLALSYALSSYKAGRHTHVIWIPATTLEKVNQGFAKVLDLMQHTDRNIRDQGARLTAARLCLERSDQQLKWLIILDDATSASLLFLREHLPRQNGHGSILITTRTFDVAEALTSVAGQQHPVLELKALSLEQSVKLLLKRAGIHDSLSSAGSADLDSAQKLVKRMGCLPLAVEQAGAYMKRSGLTGAGQLETLYDQQGFKEVISWDNSLSTYEEKSVLTTITIQFQKLDEIDPHLLMLLHVFAFFDPESIPLDIIALGARRFRRRLRLSEILKTNISLIPKPMRSGIGQVSSRRYQPLNNILPSPHTSVAPADVSAELKPLIGFICSETWLRGALRHLEDLSLARPLYGEKISLHIHDLIQLVLQRRTATYPLVEDPYCSLAVTLLCGAFETIKDVQSPQCWAECERFVPHLISFAKHGTPTIDFLAMSERVAWYFFKRGRYNEAETLYEQALGVKERQLGASHLATLATVHDLALMYGQQGRYDEAEPLYHRALGGQEQQLGADHPATLAAVHDLALLYSERGRYDEAEAMYRRALAGKERQLGVDHPDTLLTVNDLAILYRQQGRYEEAETLYNRALIGREKTIGIRHPYTLGTIKGLVELYEAQGRLEEAHMMHENAEAGPSNAATPGPTFLSKPLADQLGIDTLYQEDNVEINAVFGGLNIAGEHAHNAAAPSAQPAPSHPNATFNTPHTSGGNVNNVNGNIQSRVNHHYQGGPPIASFNPMHSLSPFNDAPVDRISPCFMGRDDDIQNIASAVGSCDGDAPSRYAVWGMPGLGKSQLALSYAHSSYKAGRHTHVIWIPATTLEKVNQGFAKVLDLTQHTDRNNPNQGARLTAARLCLERSGQQLKWLIILDDVTSASLLFLREHLPRQNAHGSILITTRTFDVAEALASVTGQQYPVHELKALSLEQSVKLLLKRAGIHDSTAADLDSAQKLVKRVGCLPLAVEQAGAYIKRSGLTGVGQLETFYDQQGLKEVISWNNSLSSYEEKSVLTTVTVQLRRLGEIDPHLLMLLHVLAFFDPESIPLDIIILGARRVGRRLRGSEILKSNISLIPTPIRSRIRQISTRRYQPLTNVLPSPDTSVALANISAELRPLIEFICSETWLRGALRHLEDLSLARPLYGERISLHVHDLIQLVLQQRTVTHPLVEDPYCSLAVTLLCGAFETIKDVELPQYWTECERFVPHLMSFAKHGTPTIDFLAMSDKVAWYFFKRGRYNEAETLYERALGVQERLLGADHPETLATVHSLAILYEQQGRYDEAEVLYHRALGGQERQLGANHPATLATVHNLALLYEQQGRYDEAEVSYHRALRGQERQLGAHHPATLVTVYGLALLYEQQGRYDEAEPLYHRALGGQERQLGADHPATLLTVHGLAVLYEQQGRCDEAEPLYHRALGCHARQLSADQPATLVTVHGLALLYEQQGRYDEAEPLYHRALGGQERQLGADHPATLLTVHVLARLYEQQGRCDEAEPLYHRALEGQERQLGADHPETLATVHGLALLYEQQGRYDEAEPLYHRALGGQERQLGTDHPATLLIVHDLALLYEQQGRLEEAHMMRDRALKRSD
ncbi:TPR-like protein [Athelia psychrophila]|uniref:TPR-like protein n=1 Tax=Athelia psychrophila TaxID=1759441 RepID=A0A167UB16_9AGAM|nr:TPR-like protein [Fibularhizoctonia sp. CBS 109695]